MSRKWPLIIQSVKGQGRGKTTVSLVESKYAKQLYHGTSQPSGSIPAPHSRGYMPKSQSRDWLSKLRTLWFSSVPSLQMPGDTSSEATTVSVHSVHIPSNSSFNDHHIIQG